MWYPYIQHTTFDIPQIFLSPSTPSEYNNRMYFDDIKNTGGDDDKKDDTPAGNEEAIAGPEAGFYENTDIPGEDTGISNAQQ